MEQANNKNIFFPENTSEIISDILEKYNIEEAEEEIDEKLLGNNDVPLRGGIIAGIVAKLSRKEISDNDVLVILQKELNLPKVTAESLANDIKTKIIPLAITKEKPVEKSSIEGESVKKTASHIGFNEILEKNAPQLIKEPIAKVAVPTKKQTIIKKPIMSEEIKENTSQSRQSTKPDNYRELIE